MNKKISKKKFLAKLIKKDIIIPEWLTNEIYNSMFAGKGKKANEYYQDIIKLAVKYPYNQIYKLTVHNGMTNKILLMDKRFPIVCNVNIISWITINLIAVQVTSELNPGNPYSDMIFKVSPKLLIHTKEKLTTTISDKLYEYLLQKYDYAAIIDIINRLNQNLLNTKIEQECKEEDKHV